MGKEAELWDDSVLINAFDAAMASYKEIHCESLSGHSINKDKDDSNENGSDTLLTLEKDESNCMESDGELMEDAKRSKVEPKESNNAVDDNINGALKYPFTEQADNGGNCAALEIDADTSDCPCVDSKLEDYSDSQILDYNELLKQYYELEQRKEKIAEQLWQANYWNYQAPAQGYKIQEQQVPVSSGSEHGPNISCPCSCHCLAATSASISTCPMARAISMGFASCPQPMCCSGSQILQEVGEKKDGVHDLSSIYKNKEILSTCPETDLISVLNAWYSAGYKTGRYLLKLDQSNQPNNKEK